MSKINFVGVKCTVIDPNEKGSYLVPGVVIRKVNDYIVEVKFPSGNEKMFKVNQLLFQ